MPIGTVDYVSTAPWNDPFNPWPAYAQVSLSAVDTNLNASGAPLIMQLTNFDPAASPAGDLSWMYQSLNQPNVDAQKNSAPKTKVSNSPIVNDSLSRFILFRTYTC